VYNGEIIRCDFETYFVIKTALSGWQVATTSESWTDGPKHRSLESC